MHAHLLTTAEMGTAANVMALPPTTVGEANMQHNLDARAGGRLTHRAP